MTSNYYLILIASVMFSCSTPEENINYHILVIEECPSQYLQRICVSKEEYERIKQISIANEEGDDVNCLIVRFTDLNNNVHETYFRGYGSSPDNSLCD